MTDNLFTPIITEAKSQDLRLLIEVEPSGNIHTYCDAPNKRKILGMIRKNKINRRILWHITNENTKYEKPQDVRYLETDKGVIARRF